MRPAITDPAYASAQRLVEVEPGRKMNIYCVGEGSPTVVFDAGMNNWSQIWGYVQPAVARRTRACAYDRAGLGFSDPGSRPSSSANIVDDLHKLLVAAGVAPPYVLVGHSYGGMNVRLYADTYRDDVAGLVLDDPSHEDSRPRYDDLYARYGPPSPTPAQRIAKRDADDAAAHVQEVACLDAAEKGFVEGTPIFSQCVSTGQNLRYSPEINAVYQRLERQHGFLRARISEEDNFDHDSPAQLRAGRRPFGDMPMVVLTRDTPACSNDKPCLAPCAAADSPRPCHGNKRLGMILHDELAQLSTRGVHRMVPHSTHDIHLDQPQAVIDAIFEVLDALKTPANKS